MAVTIVTRYRTTSGSEHETLEAAQIAEQVDGLAEEIRQAGILLDENDADSIANWLFGNFDLNRKPKKPKAPPWPQEAAPRLTDGES